MAREVFEVSLSRGRARRRHVERSGDLANAFAWESLDPAAFDPGLVAATRVSWTEAAFNEHCTAAAMARMFDVLSAARAPLDLLSAVHEFLGHEIAHVELCSRVAMRLGGGAPIEYDPDDIVPPLDPSLSPLQRANELVVRVCCVGEAFTFPLLAGAGRSATHPVTRGVLARIVRDEAQHGPFGWDYLAWIGAELSPAERDRLGRAAARAIAELDPIWKPLRPWEDGRTMGGYPAGQANALGWMEGGAYREAARASEADVRDRLAAHGIRVPPREP